MRCIAVAIGAFARHVQTVRWMTVTLWRQANGRLYYFRDCPYWFVAQAASLDIDEDDNEQVREYRRTARLEMQLRLQLLLRDAEKAIEAAQREASPRTEL